MLDEIMALAMAAATTLVGAMATDACAGTRDPRILDASLTASL